MNEISKRILQYMEYKNLKPMEFMLSIGYKSVGNYSRMKQGNPPSDDTINPYTKYSLFVAYLGAEHDAIKQNIAIMVKLFFVIIY